MSEARYASPEEAARGDVPERYSQVIASRREGDLAVVLLALNEGEVVEEDVNICAQDSLGWYSI